ncbi:MAG: alpha-L-fucosidase, partial [Prolixibacteraceae bacterium]
THIRHVFTGGPQGADYCAYVDAHYKELINNYQPDILWNDIGYPKAGDLETILGNYFFQVPHGTVNNRWQRKGIYNGDFVTPEYSKLDSITPFKWETCRGIGFSFGYNRLEGPEEYMSGTEIVQLLVDIVSKNGNLLLNIGPKADGTVPAEQKQALQEVGEWLQTNGEGIYGSRPWKRFGTTTADGAEIRFTQKADVIYLFAWNVQDKAVSIPENLLPEFEKVVQIAKSNRIDWKKKDNTITFVLPGDTDKEFPVCLKLKK